MVHCDERERKLSVKFLKLARLSARVANKLNEADACHMNFDDLVAAGEAANQMAYYDPAVRARRAQKEAQLCWVRILRMVRAINTCHTYPCTCCETEVHSSNKLHFDTFMSLSCGEGTHQKYLWDI